MDLCSKRYGVCQGLFPVFTVLTEKQQDKENNHSQKGAPLQFVRKEAEQNKPQVFCNNGPAGTPGIPAHLPRGVPNTVDEGPSDKRQNGFPQKKKGHDRQR